MPVLFLLFLLIPIAEIWLLIQVGGIVGAGWTITLVVTTAILGAALVRAQGLSALRRIQQDLAAGGLPADEMVQGVFLLVAGALLLTPGFFTDALGFTLLVPPVRRDLARRLFASGMAFGVNAATGGTGQRPGPGAPKGDAIEGEFHRED